MSFRLSWSATWFTVVACLVLGHCWADDRAEAPKSNATEAQNKWARAIKSQVEVTGATALKLRLIPPGEFLMGSTDADIDGVLKTHPAGRREWWNLEQPQHKVRLSQPFYLGTYEITQEQYAQVMGRNPSWFAQGAHGEDQVRGLDTRRFPVEGVSWFDAVAFCNKLSEKEHLPPYYRLNPVLNVGHSIAAARVEIIGRRGYRLPTEAEWEYACRGGSFESLGMRHLPPAPQRQDAQRTSRVGSGKPNAFGLFDMQGNVREWCQDLFSESYYGESPSADPAGPPSGDKRVQRGGSWLGTDWGRRCESRVANEPGEADGSVGLRVARNP
jgi:formylglycine-generating enzyme required for sulfatase activity